MIQKLKNTVLALAAVSLAIAPTMIMAPAAFAAVTQNQLQGDLCSGTNFNLTNGSSGSNTCSTDQTNNLNGVLAKVINVFSIIVGVIAVIMIIVGGLRYITSGGDSGKVSTAKTTIIYALIGLVVVALAQLIVHYVLSQASTIGS